MSDAELQSVLPQIGVFVDYKFNFFDIVRVENGKIAEHWDSVFRNPPANGQPSQAGVIQGVGPKPVAVKNSAAEQKVEQLVKAGDDKTAPEMAPFSGDKQ